jgi:hypothetical protein
MLGASPSPPAFSGCPPVAVRNKTPAVSFAAGAFLLWDDGADKEDYDEMFEPPKVNGVDLVVAALRKVRAIEGNARCRVSHIARV